MSENEAQPWDRRPNESSKAYEGFVTYRDMGAERTIDKVAEQLDKSRAIISRWSHTHEWRVRSSAWDSMPGRKIEEAYAEMAGRIAAQHDRVATKLLDRLEQGMDSLPEGKTPTQSWSLAHAAARQGHGFATDLVKPESSAKEEISKQITALINRLAGEE